MVLPLCSRPRWLLSRWASVGKPGKVVLVLAGCNSRRKAVIVKSIEGGTSDHPYSHALEAGIDHHPCKVTAAMGKKEIAKRTKIKSFVKVYNYNHFMPTDTVWISPWTNLLTKMSLETLLWNTRPDRRPRSSSKGGIRKGKWFFQKLQF